MVCVPGALTARSATAEKLKVLHVNSTTCDACIMSWLSQSMRAGRLNSEPRLRFSFSFFSLFNIDNRIAPFRLLACALPLALIDE